MTKDVSQLFPTIRRLAARFDRRASAAVEFAMVAPILAMLLAGAVDFGGALYRNFLLDSAVSSATNFALRSGERVTATDSQQLAAQLANIMAQSDRIDGVQLQVVVNNGPRVSVSEGTASQAGSASAAAACYCPTRGSSGIQWGSSVTCGSACPSGLAAGKFVYLSMARPYEPFFPDLVTSLVDVNVGATAMVQVQ